jgi:hypothetical protein
LFLHGFPPSSEVGNKFFYNLFGKGDLSFFGNEVCFDGQGTAALLDGGDFFNIVRSIADPTDNVVPFYVKTAFYLETESTGISQNMVGGIVAYYEKVNRIFRREEGMEKAYLCILENFYIDRYDSLYRDKFLSLFASKLLTTRIWGVSV